MEVEVPGGRNRRLQLGGLTLLDETYNASPEAVLAALDLLAAQPGRRFAVLGTMLELGDQSVALHRQVAERAAALGLDGLVIVASGAEAEPESWSALLIGLQLGLLVLIQWPVGRALALRPVGVGLGLSLVCFSGGTLLLAASAFSQHGIALVVIALAVVALGEAAFLPTATEAVIELSPKGHGGLAMALFSQCFALSAFAAPLMAGVLLDRHGHGVSLWLATALTCGLSLLLVGPVQRRSKRRPT